MADILSQAQTANLLEREAKASCGDVGPTYGLTAFATSDRRRASMDWDEIQAEIKAANARTRGEA